MLAYEFDSAMTKSEIERFLRGRQEAGWELMAVTHLPLGGNVESLLWWQKEMDWQEYHRYRQRLVEQ